MQIQWVMEFRTRASIKDSRKYAVLRDKINKDMAKHARKLAKKHGLVAVVFEDTFYEGRKTVEEIVEFLP